MRVWHFVFGCLPLLISNISGAADFPAVKAAASQFEISVSDKPNFLSYPIKGIDGEDLYWLLCFSGTDKALDKLSGESGINFVAPFACRVSTENEQFSERTFLAEQSGISYWHTRGSFSFRELEEPCGSYPEYGRVRHFELRGFKLTLVVSNIINSDSRMGFTLDIEVISDNNAATPNAKPITMPRPKWVNGKCELPD
jgi:hypothetical protein